MSGGRSAPARARRRATRQVPTGPAPPRAPRPRSRWRGRQRQHDQRGVSIATSASAADSYASVQMTARRLASYRNAGTTLVLFTGPAQLPRGHHVGEIARHGLCCASRAPGEDAGPKESGVSTPSDPTPRSRQPQASTTGRYHRHRSVRAGGPISRLCPSSHEDYRRRTAGPLSDRPCERLTHRARGRSTGRRRGRRQPRQGGPSADPGTPRPSVVSRGWSHRVRCRYGFFS